jgi:DMSO reductase anchor subunit
MHAPWSMIFFTTLTGAAQGLMLALVALEFANPRVGALSAWLLNLAGAAVVLVLCGAGLVAAMFHLGHPLRAWRSVAMWRTSWMSREVIVLPAFMAVVFAWGAAHWLNATTTPWSIAAALLAVALYICTGMIYAAVKAMREWAHPVTPINFLLLGLASGLTLAAALAAACAALLHVPVLASIADAFARAALVATLAGAATRGWALWRNLNLVPKTTLQSAIGVRHPRIVQISQGAMGGSFNTREFMHRAGGATVTRVRWAAALLGFALPAAALALGARAPLALAAVFVLQWIGLLAERWSFFTEARHPQNLYTQATG